MRKILVLITLILFSLTSCVKNSNKNLIPDYIGINWFETEANTINALCIDKKDIEENLDFISSLKFKKTDQMLTKQYQFIRLHFIYGPDKLGTYSVMDYYLIEDNYIYLNFNVNDYYAYAKLKNFSNEEIYDYISKNGERKIFEKASIHFLSLPPEYYLNN